VKTYSWNADDRLTTATGAPGTRSYGYSFSGARASETGGQNRSWLRRGTGVTSPVLRDGVSRYSPGSSVRPLAGGDSAFQHGGWKSFEAQTGPTGAVTGTKEYDAFGAQLASTGAWQGALSHGGGFGYQSDDTGLQLLGHRYYDPSTGRFLTRDPIKDGPNWYAYCLNDPVNAADPTGLWFWVVVIAAIVIYDVIDTANDIREAPTNPETYAWVAVGAVDPTPGNLGKKAGRWLKGFIERHHSFPQAEAGKIIEVQPDKEGHPAFKEIVPMPFENHRGKGSIHSQGYNKMIADEIEKRGGYDGITDEGIDEIMDWLRGKGLR
jgi:RHS repeat-associated protein